jgi:hypothetical protein
MGNRGWDSPVLVVCKRTGQMLTVNTTNEARDILLNAWPTAEGKAFMMALQICADVDAGIREPREAREAFIIAAREADVPIEISMEL